MPETLLTTTVAGVNAAVVESILTYPLEYIKTRQQLHRELKGSTSKLHLPEPGRAYFRGCSPMILGNVTRAVYRFSFYNWATKFMADDRGNASAPQIVVAGMLTGILESLIVVPFESIKVTMIQRSIGPSPGVGSSLSATAATLAKNLHKPTPHTRTHTQSQTHTAASKSSTNATSKPANIRPPATPHTITQVTELYGLGANVRAMFAERGLRSLVQGFWPTILRQATNSAVKFTSYNFLKQLVQPTNSGEALNIYMAFGLGMTSGMIQTLATQPIDVVKTRMQSINGPKIYGSSLRCGLMIFAQEGFTKLWTGMFPRFLKISLSGGIVFGVYEMTNGLLVQAMNENPFQWK